MCDHAKLVATMLSTIQALGQPKKDVSFSDRDPRSIKAAFRRLAEEEEARSRPPAVADSGDIDVQEKEGIQGLRLWADTGNRLGINQNYSEKVPVNKDFLLDVDIDTG